MNSLKDIYESNGYYFPININEEIKINLAKEKLIQLSNNPPKNIKHPWNLQAHLLADWIYDLCVAPKLLDAVEKVIGPNIFIQSADIFIKPGWNINSVDGLITNFHTPKSSLLAIIYSIIGERRTRQLYKFAIDKKLRFFSYGDACLIWNR